MPALKSTYLIDVKFVHHGEGAQTVQQNLKKHNELLETIRLRTKQVAEAQKHMESQKALYGAQSQQFTRAAGALGQRTKMLNEAKAAQESFTKSLNETADQLATTRTLMSATPIGKFAEQWTKLGVVFRRVADALASFLIIRLVYGAFQAFFGTIAEANIQLELMRARLSQIHSGRGSFSDLLETIKTLTVQTPFVIKDFVQATVTLAAFGLSAEKYLGPIADWAATVGREVTDIALAFSKIAAGSPRTALLLSTRGISKEEFDLELKTTKNRAEALANIVNRNFEGMAKRTSETFYGMLTNIQDAFFLLAENLGKPVFRSLSHEVRMLYEAMTEKEGVAEELSKIGGQVGLLLLSLVKATAVLVIFTGVIKGIGFVASLATAGLTQLFQIMGATTALAGRVASTFTVLTTLTFVAWDAIRTWEDYYDAQHKVAELMTGKLIPGSQKTIVALENLQMATESLADSWGGRFIASIKEFLDLNIATRIKVISDSVEQYVQRLLTLPAVVATLLDIRSFEDFQKFGQTIIDTATPLQMLTSLFEKLSEVWGGVTEKLAEEARQLKELIEIQYKLRASQVGIRGFNTAKDIFELQEEIKGLEGGGQVLDMLIKRMEQLKRHAEELGESGGFVEHFLELFQGAKTMTRQQLINKALEEAQRIINELETKALSTEKGLPDPTVIKDLLNGLIDVEKIIKTLDKDYTQEIAAEKERIMLLEQGETAAYAQLQSKRKLMEQNLAYYEKIKGTSKDQDTIDKAELDYLKARVAYLDQSVRLEESMVTARARLLELGRKLYEVQSQLVSATLQRGFQRTGNVGLLRERLLGEHGRLTDLADEIQLEMTGVNAEIATIQARMQGKTGEDRAADEKKLIEQLQIRVQLQQRLAESLIDLIAVANDYDNIQSTMFGEAWSKRITKAIIALTEFKDELADLLYTGGVETIKGVISDYLFGDEKLADDLYAARKELDLLRMEEGQRAADLQIYRRGEGEIQSAYELRLRAQEAMQEREAVQYQFRTKELELLEKINELERERNSIILERLKQLGSKVFDKFLDFGIQRFFTSIFSGYESPFGPRGEPVGGTPPSGQSWGGGGGPTREKPSIIIQGDVYGFDEFQRRVDDAIAVTSRKRNR